MAEARFLEQLVAPIASKRIRNRMNEYIAVATNENLSDIQKDVPWKIIVPEKRFGLAGITLRQVLIRPTFPPEVGVYGTSQGMEETSNRLTREGIPENQIKNQLVPYEKWLANPHTSMNNEATYLIDNKTRAIIMHLTKEGGTGRIGQVEAEAAFANAVLRGKDFFLRLEIPELKIDKAKGIDEWSEENEVWRSRMYLAADALYWKTLYPDAPIHISVNRSIGQQFDSIVDYVDGDNHRQDPTSSKNISRVLNTQPQLPQIHKYKVKATDDIVVIGSSREEDIRQIRIPMMRQLREVFGENIVKSTYDNGFTNNIILQRLKEIDKISGHRIGDYYESDHTQTYQQFLGNQTIMSPRIVAQSTGSFGAVPQLLIAATFSAINGTQCHFFIPEDKIGENNKNGDISARNHIMHLSRYMPAFIAHLWIAQEDDVDKSISTLVNNLQKARKKTKSRRRSN